MKGSHGFIWFSQSFVSSDTLTSPPKKNVAASSAPVPPMRRLFSTSRPLLSSMASDPPHWRQLAPDPPVRRVCRFLHGSQSMANVGGVRGKKESDKPDSRSLIPSAKDIMIPLDEHSQLMKNVENSDTTNEFPSCYGYGHPVNVEEDERRTRGDVIYDDEACSKTMEVIDGKQETWLNVLVDTNKRATKGYNREIGVNDDKENVSRTTEIPHDAADTVFPLHRLPDSSHRDGSIYREIYGWTEEFRIADRTETRFEAMMLSDATNCIMRNGTCIYHLPCPMLQIFSLKVAKIPVDTGSVELYGYIAARDSVEPLLNYVVNVSRDDPIIVEQGSLINMAPKRGISLVGTTLIEYDMKIKTGGHEKDDPQLIDGLSFVGLMGTANCYVFTRRIIGDCGAVDMTASCLDEAVEATVQVVISEVQGSFNMSLGCFFSELDEETQLFDGTIVESHGLRRYVVAVLMDTQMDLKFKVGSERSSSSEYCCSFKAHNHGHVSELIKTDFASIAVKVTWSIIPCRLELPLEIRRRYRHDK